MEGPNVKRGAVKERKLVVRTERQCCSRVDVSRQKDEAAFSGSAVAGGLSEKGAMNEKSLVQESCRSNLGSLHGSCGGPHSGEPASVCRGRDAQFRIRRPRFEPTGFLGSRHRRGTGQRAQRVDFEVLLSRTRTWQRSRRRRRRSRRRETSCTGTSSPPLSSTLATPRPQLR